MLRAWEDSITFKDTSGVECDGCHVKKTYCARHHIVRSENESIFKSRAKAGKQSAKRRTRNASTTSRCSYNVARRAVRSSGKKRRNSTRKTAIRRSNSNSKSQKLSSQEIENIEQIVTKSPKPKSPTTNGKVLKTSPGVGFGESSSAILYRRQNEVIANKPHNAGQKCLTKSCFLENKCSKSQQTGSTPQRAGSFLWRRVTRGSSKRKRSNCCEKVSYLINFNVVGEKVAWHIWPSKIGFALLIGCVNCKGACKWQISYNVLKLAISVENVQSFACLCLYLECFFNSFCFSCHFELVERASQPNN